jgi:pimeloyl-ACP methyl ester carboxylesterase
MWSPQRAALSEAGWRAITPDQRGFGGTALEDSEPSLDALADDLAAVLDSRRISEPIVLGGLSMGGYVAMAFMRRHADRVAALVLADTKASADTPEAAANRERIAVAVEEAESSALLVEELLPKLVGSTTLERRPLVVGRVKALVETARPAAVAWAQRAMAARPDSRESLGKVGVPTLVVVGEEDQLSSPAEAEELAAAVPGASLVRIPASGHLTAVETPDEFNDALLSFLATL